MFHTPGSTAKGHISLDRAHQLEDKKNRPCSILNYHQLPSQTVFLLQVKALGLRLWPPSQIWHKFLRLNVPVIVIRTMMPVCWNTQSNYSQIHKEFLGTRLGQRPKINKHNWYKKYCSLEPQATTALHQFDNGSAQSDSSIWSKHNWYKNTWATSNNGSAQSDSSIWSEPDFGWATICTIRFINLKWAWSIH